VIVQTDVRDRLELLTGELTGKRSYSEKIPDLRNTYDPVLKRI
jgi:hypothetical protein